MHMAQRELLVKLLRLPTLALGMLLVICGLGIGRVAHAASPALYHADPNQSLNENLSAAINAGEAGLLIPAHTALQATGPISLPSGFALVGESAETSGIAFKTMPNYDGFILEKARDNVFARLVIDCSAVAPPPGVEYNRSSVILLRECADVLVERVTFLKAPRHALAGACPGLTVRNCRFLDGGFLRINVSGDRQAVLYNRFEEGGWWALQPGGKGHLYLGNLFANTGNGIQTGGLGGSLVAHNYCQDLVGHGVWLTGPGARGNILAFNDYRVCGYETGSDDVMSAMCAIQSWGGAYNLMVGNFARDTAGYGINISGTGGLQDNDNGMGNVVSDNILVRAYDPVILVNNAACTVVRRNRSGPSNSLGLHIGCEVGASTVGALLAKVINNYCWANSYEGARIDACYGMLFQGNWIINSGGTGPAWGLGIASYYLDKPGLGLHMYNTIIGNTVADLRAHSSGRTQRWALHVQDAPAGAERNIGHDLICWNRFYGSLESELQMSEAMKARHTIKHNDLTGRDLATLREAPPLADAGPSLVVGDGSQVVLTGVRSRFLDGRSTRACSYRWSQVSGPPVNASGAETPNLRIAIPEVKEPTVFGFELTVIRPDTGLSTKDWVYVGAYDDEWIPPSLASAATGVKPLPADAPDRHLRPLSKGTAPGLFCSTPRGLRPRPTGSLSDSTVREAKRRPD